MKKIFLLLAITSVAFFSSCKEDETEPNNNTSTPQTASIINMENLKSYVGKSHSEISSSITAKGYTLTSSEDGEYEGTKNYTYTSAQTLTGGKQCIIGEYNNVIYTAAFADMGTNRTEILSNFATLSNNAYSVLGNLQYDYMGSIDELDFDSHQSFINHFNTYSVSNACLEGYNSNSEDLTEMIQASVMYQQINAKTTYCSLTEMYIDFLLSPQNPGFKNKK